MGDMRGIVMFNWLTADGYFAGPDAWKPRSTRRATSCFATRARTRWSQSVASAGMTLAPISSIERIVVG